MQKPLQKLPQGLIPPLWLVLYFKGSRHYMRTVACERCGAHRSSLRKHSMCSVALSWLQAPGNIIPLPEDVGKLLYYLCPVSSMEIFESSTTTPAR